jgi:hypothetical protein
MERTGKGGSQRETFLPAAVETARLAVGSLSNTQWLMITRFLLQCLL